METLSTIVSCPALSQNIAILRALTSMHSFPYTNYQPFGNGQSLSQGFSILNETIFRDAARKGTFTKYKSLFPGLGFAAGYKVAQRMYKFTGQRHVKDYMNNNHASTFKSLFGDNWKTMMHATAGSIVGVGEIVLLPLDALKIKMQINPASIQGKGLYTVIAQE
ncbi:hypothetical protein HK100_010000, partial [Physocladia obscura]